jgi:hypothetical protein
VSRRSSEQRTLVRSLEIRRVEGVASERPLALKATNALGNGPKRSFPPLRERVTILLSAAVAETALIAVP